MTSRESPIKLEVLIIGGGIQGLWVLKELVDRKYSALLVEEKVLAARQTGHSHAYLHLGDFFRSPKLHERLVAARGHWETFLERNASPIILKEAHLVFAGEMSGDSLSLPAHLVASPVPHHAAFPDARSTLVTKTETLDAAKLVRAIVEGSACAERIKKIRGVESLHVSGANPDIEVEVSLADGTTKWIAPQALVLAAGACNGALIDMIAGASDRAFETGCAQQLRLTHMLVIEEIEPNTLPSFTGQLYPEPEDKAADRIFIASRTANGRTIWLVSTGLQPERFRSPAGTGDLVEGRESPTLASTSEDQRDFLGNLLPLMEKLGVFSRCSQSGFRWAVYPAIKAEGCRTTRKDNPGQLPQGEADHKLCRRVYAVWPNLLTLAPVAAESILRQLKEDDGIIGSGTDGPLASWPDPDTKHRDAAELWTHEHVKCMPWEAFCNSIGYKP